jgi:ribonuclease BN (tRNA processing enzyme)
MQLHLLGTAGYHPNSRRHTSCFMLPELGVVFDAGTGFFRVRERLQTETLDIFVTHAHLDHVVGLSFLFSTVYETGLQTVRVHGAAEKLDAISKNLLCDPLFPAKLPCTFHPLTEPVRLANGARVSFHPLAHPGGSLGYRLEAAGKSLAYITDTTAKKDADYLSLISGVDLLLHECNFDDAMSDWAVKTGHSYLTPVAEVARLAGVKRAVLIHLNPLRDTDEPLCLASVRDVFPAMEIGRDEQVIDF